MSYDDLTPEQREKLAECQTPEETIALARKRTAILPSTSSKTHRAVR